LERNINAHILNFTFRENTNAKLKTNTKRQFCKHQQTCIAVRALSSKQELSKQPLGLLIAFLAEYGTI
jgi:hypothetical protein